jgi:hypothetical protein
MTRQALQSALRSAFLATFGHRAWLVGTAGEQILKPDLPADRGLA